MKATDYIVEKLVSHGITTVFGYQGGMITHLVDSLGKHDKIQFIQTYHEQSAAIAAEGYARESGLFGVAISTSGPGATNMITGIANAFFDSIPVLYITGQVNSYEYKYDKRKRQQGFQETDVVSIVKPITKYAKLVDSVESLEHELSKAISIAISGRKGPVLLDITMDVQRADLNPIPGFRYLDPERNTPMANPESMQQAVNALLKARRPLVICGGGVSASGLQGTVQAFLERLRLPYVITLMGKGSVKEDRENFIGLIGSYGNRNANMALYRADVVLVLGSRLDLRQTGNQRSTSLSQKTFIHVDIDRNELDESLITGKVNIQCDVGVFISSALDSLSCMVIDENWTDTLSIDKSKYCQKMEIKRFVRNPTPYFAIESIQRLSDDATIYTADIGQNQMWSAQYIQLYGNQRFYTSGGLAPMGYALHAAIGAAFASPYKCVVCIIGDGGFHMALQSLMLISQYALNVTVYVLNNESLGMITQFQELYFNSKFYGTKKSGGYTVPDFKGIASAYGLGYTRIVGDQVFSSISNRIRGGIIEYVLEDPTTVSPKLEFDKELYNMSPTLPENELTDFLG